VLDQIGIYVIIDRLSDLGAAGIIEKDGWTPQGRELRADRWKIEGQGNPMNSSKYTW